MSKMKDSDNKDVVIVLDLTCDECGKKFSVDKSDVVENRSSVICPFCGTVLLVMNT